LCRRTRNYSNIFSFVSWVKHRTLEYIYENIWAYEVKVTKCIRYSQPRVLLSNHPNGIVIVENWSVSELIKCIFHLYGILRNVYVFTQARCLTLSEVFHMLMSGLFKMCFLMVQLCLCLPNGFVSWGLSTELLVKVAAYVDVRNWSLQYYKRDLKAVQTAKMKFLMEVLLVVRLKNKYVTY
jgi:hypothetical protein